MKNTRDFHNMNMKASANQLGHLLPITTTTTTTLHPYTTCSDLLGLGGSDNLTDGIITEQPSSRWNPTAEQLLALEEMYRRGTRTPSADQIQQIASQLRRFGKIEGKNVFYWFQNHKARERQKRRRESDFNTTTLKLHAGFLEEEEDKIDLGSFQHQQKKTLYCTEYLEGTFPLHRAESTITNNNGWPGKKNYTWHDQNNPTTSSSRSSNFEENQINTTMMLKPENNNPELEEVEIETLELFPVCKSNGSEDSRRKKITRPINTNQYFEFLKEHRN